MGPASTSGSSNDRPTVSPPSASSSAAALQYQSGMPASTMSPHVGGSVGLAGPTGPADLRLSAPNAGMGQSISWHQPSAHYTTELSSQRPSWDFSGFMDNGLAPVTAGQSGPITYNRIPSISQSLGFPQFLMPSQEYKDYNSQRATQA